MFRIRLYIVYLPALVDNHSKLFTSILIVVKHRLNSSCNISYFSGGWISCGYWKLYQGHTSHALKHSLPLHNYSQLLTNRRVCQRIVGIAMWSPSPWLIHVFAWSRLQSFYGGRTSWRLLQKRGVCTRFDIYVFIIQYGEEHDWCPLEF